MADGTLYTGLYPYTKWISKEVLPHYGMIHANRKQGGGISTRKGSTMKREAELHAQISELESTKRRMISEMKTRQPEDDKTKSGGGGSVSGSCSGTASGGRAEKAGNKWRCWWEWIKNIVQVLVLKISKYKN